MGDDDPISAVGAVEAVMTVVMVSMVVMIVVVMLMTSIVLNSSIIVGVRAVHDVVALMEVVMEMVSVEMLIIMLMVVDRQRHRWQRTLLLTLSSIIPSLGHLLDLRNGYSSPIAGSILTGLITLVLAAVACVTTMVPGFLLAPAPEVEQDGDDEADENQANGEAGGCGGGYFAVVRATGVKHGGLVVVVEAGHVEDGEHHGRL